HKGVPMTSRPVMKAGLVAGLALSFQVASTQIQVAQQPGPQPGPAAARAQQAPRGGARGHVDSRGQQPEYPVYDRNEALPYALFVSSKVSKDRKNLLIVALHGLGGDQNTMVRESFRSVELAEQGGYILVAPMGYNSGGWYGIPPGAPGGGRGRGAANGA